MSIIELRVKLLKEMDAYAREHFSEDTFYEYWLADGVPDAADDITLSEIASIENCWLNCINAFAICCKAEGIIPE